MMKIRFNPEHRGRIAGFVFAALVSFLFVDSFARAQLAVRGEIVHTMAGDPITDGVVIMREGKVAAVGKAADIEIPGDFRVLRAAVVTPGLIDAHTVVGLSGQYNYSHDQDQLETSKPIQPQLRAIDAYNSKERLVDWVRSFGVTTIHTGHAPGEIVSGQTMIVKTTGNTVEDAMMVEAASVAVTLGEKAMKERDSKQAPGTRSKVVAMLRQKLIAAQNYRDKRDHAEQGEDANEDHKPEPPARDLEMETFADVLAGKMPLMITAHRAQDIANALRLAREFDIQIILDGGAESYRMIDEIKAAKIPVFIHPTMIRAAKETEHMSFETASKLIAAGIPVALQSGYEKYVPKTRIILFEAGWAAANGLTFEQALATITINPAKILGIDKRVGSIEPGKDADLALYDGDPFEYTTHCVGTIIEGEVVSDVKR